MSQSQPTTAPAFEQRGGMLFAFAAYGFWGFMPIYFLVLAPAGPFEIVAWRVLFSVIFCALIILVMRSWGALRRLLRDRRTMLTLGLAGVLVFINWQVYVIAVVSGRVNEAALGYFINPIVTVLLGVIVLHERLRVTQWVAVGVSGVAVIVLAVNYGSFPWISLALAFSFGLYGLAKKRVGPRVDAVTGLAVETAWLTPIAIVQLVFVGATTGVVFGTAGVANTVLLAAAGIVTSVPLLLFAAAARRLPLIVIGFVQYLTPILQFLIGTFILHEAMPLERWIGFSLVWLALVILSTDMVHHTRSVRRASPLPG
ncbi:chloramphenicol-sensitive protein RarD [Cryobacterium mesophilum]|uniref:EamA family transporter RarD n=1 Tax=Terrimesophilobacter mesophilus TaxID=433647 RepID=A0A4R8VAR2_9MICO|nr:EamA family transporter RarD [Terrimesophilobacter mesophilus]MBB5632880.1 chloramphenicol-sensitive protein RarD [Terrimesophilobacter mesophilus]TFB79655.1 EamA family transporter RarD [Terrimesophilobacter mesophilus]